MPLPLDRLQNIKHIVTHENCADGMASAMILKDVFPEAKVTFAQYGTPAHRELEPEEGMIFCDFSPHIDKLILPNGREPSKEELRAYAENDPKLKEFVDAGTIVLDHHKTQDFVVERFGDLGVFGDEKTEPGVCGASLAFREVWRPLTKSRLESAREQGEGFLNWKALVDRVETLATLAGIRDTWQKHDPQWLQACEQAEALTFWPEERLLGLDVHEWDEKLSIGPMLYERRLHGVRKCIENGWRFTTGHGTRVIVFEGTRQTSDAAEILDQEVDLVVGFMFRKDGDRMILVYSTRSHTGFNCAAYAKSHPTGGGHTAAAGFSVPLEPHHDANPYKMLWEDLHQYEGAQTKQQWHLSLNEYQRDNLVWLLAACGYPAPEAGGEPVEPFTLANTGDWLGEVAIKLDYEEGLGSPNSSLEDLRSAVSDWKRR